MAIVETKIYGRADTSIPFYQDMPSSLYITSLKAQRAELISAVSASSTISSDGTQLTVVYTIPDLATMSLNDTSLSLELDADYINYCTNANMYGISYSLTGIDSPFTCSTIYSFPTAGTEIHNKLSSELSRNRLGRLSNLVVTDNTITAVHQYQNAADFTAAYYSDFQFAKDLHAVGVTRTITYAPV